MRFLFINEEPADAEQKRFILKTLKNKRLSLFVLIKLMF